MEVFADHLGWFCRGLLRSSGQACVLILFIFAVQLLFRPKLPPPWRYGLWLLLLVRLIMPWSPPSRLSVFNLIPSDYPPPPSTATVTPLVTDNINNYPPYTPHPQPPFITNDIVRDQPAEYLPPPSPITSAETSSRAAEAAAIANPPPENMPPVGIAPFLRGMLPWLWLIGALGLLAYLVGANFRFWRKIRLQPSITDQHTLNLLMQCKKQLRVHTPLALVVTDQVKNPALFGFIRPRLLLPSQVVNCLSPQQLRFVFLHELAHLKRHDILLGWLTALLQILHWFNPLVWLAFHRMRSDRELACDAMVLAQMQAHESKHYGQTIVRLLEHFSRPRYLPGMVGILENQAHLKRRIAMIAQTTKPARSHTLIALLLTAFLAAVTFTDAVAQQPQKNPSPAPSPMESLDEYIIKTYDISFLPGLFAYPGNFSEQINATQRTLLYELIKRAVPADSWRDSAPPGAGKGKMVFQNNALTITQTPPNHQRIKQVLQELFLSTQAQIFLELKVLSAGMSFIEDVGLDQDFYLNLQNAAASLPDKPAKKSSPFLMAGSILDDRQTEWMTETEKTSSGAGLLADRTVTVLNGQTAYFSLGETFNYVSGKKPAAHPAAVSELKVDPLDLPLSLSFTPVITSNLKTVYFPEITVNQTQLEEIHTFITKEQIKAADPNTPPLAGEPTAHPPYTAGSSITTSLMVPDGATLLLGGQIITAETRGEKKVPLLGDIPVVGMFFRNRDQITDQSILLILLKSTIILAEEEEIDITDIWDRQRPDQQAIKLSDPNLPRGFYSLNRFGKSGLGMMGAGARGMGFPDMMGGMMGGMGGMMGGMGMGGMGMGGMMGGFGMGYPPGMMPPGMMGGYRRGGRGAGEPNIIGGMEMMGMGMPGMMWGMPGIGGMGLGGMGMGGMGMGGMGMGGMGMGGMGMGGMGMGGMGMGGMGMGGMGGMGMGGMGMGGMGMGGMGMGMGGMMGGFGMGYSPGMMGGMGGMGMGGYGISDPNIIRSMGMPGMMGEMGRGGRDINSRSDPQEEALETVRKFLYPNPQEKK